jgi:hypothetical protein
MQMQQDMLIFIESLEINTPLNIILLFFLATSIFLPGLPRPGPSVPPSPYRSTLPISFAV